ncbi:glycoside hydrolase family 3 protein [Pseudomassariella vexata]|uniref:beta-glucosidase n=1 Tax=Pseudomassariella vexata TaxID=1141098 RepID=A0A1Y2E613_9PEZI|nr:glycoside hydrolase family 3 protein [Pseudomassariella vexata]ORY67003.1 glycoside hydrolase family 3 protein [Pseudomassariella vexata]
MVSILSCIVIGLASQQARIARAQDVITSDDYFYGQSPPVYPSPNGTGLGNWADAYIKARNFVSQLTLEEKVNLTGGVSETSTSCSGSIAAIPRLNFPGMCLSDAGNGVRSTDFVSGWPSGLSVGASWNRDLAHARAAGMTSEFRRKGVNIALGPVVGPLGRVAMGGRNWEVGFSNDPYLCGALAYETVVGMQSTGVTASVKHYIANEQETNRNPEASVGAVSSNVDDKTMHELYLWPFQDAILAGAGNIMCSYNRLNNSHGCANSKSLNGILKTELGFQGFVVSDWGAQHAGVATAQAGLDMVMPRGSAFWGNNLTLAVKNGSLSETRVDDMTTRRIIAMWYQFGQDDAFPEPGVGMPSELSSPHEVVIGTNSSYKRVLFDGAVEGHVLLKNKDNALPLKTPRIVSLFGYSAKAPDRYTTDENIGNEALAPEDISIMETKSNIISQYASNGTIISGGGSGANQFPYMSSPFEALSQRAYEDGSFLYWDFHSSNPTVNAQSDACIVDGNVYATEGQDRPGLHDDFTDGLILNVASVCANTIVVFQNAGVRLVDQFIDHPNVTALIFGHVPGQDSGRALISILYGDSNPSGKLPYSVPKNESDYAGLDTPDQPEGIFVKFPQSNFSEGVYIDYRALDAKNITPRYEFGFGLSYTTFSFSDIKTTLSNSSTAAYPTQPIAVGGQKDLWDILATVTATVTNIGEITGAEVAQLYVGIPGGPARQLRGFEKATIQPGASVTVSFSLTRRDLSTWDVVAQKWLLQRGTYEIHVGSSSRNLPLTTTLQL